MKIGVVFIVLRNSFFLEVFLEEVEERLANGCYEVFVVWWIEKDDPSFSVSAVCSRWLCCLNFS